MTNVAIPASASRTTASSRRPRAAFYCVSNERYFLGAVAMINSLRLLGHSEPIFVLDCGLRPAQRELLATEAMVLTAPDESPPVLLKTHAPLRHPAEVVVLIDADIIVTRSLDGLIDRALQGRVLAVDDGQDRFFSEWGELTGGQRRPPSLRLVVPDPARRVGRAAGDRDDGQCPAPGRHRAHPLFGLVSRFRLARRQL